MATKKLKIGQGTTVGIGPIVGNTAVTYTTLENVKSIELAGIETAQVEITNFGSNGMREYTPGLKDGGTVSINMLVDAGDTQDNMIFGLTQNQTNASLRVTIPNTTATALEITYEGFVTSYTPSVDFENVGEATMEFKVSSVSRSTS